MTSQAVGLGAAVDYLSHVGMQHVSDHEAALTEYALHQLSASRGSGSSGRPDMRGPRRSGVVRRRRCPRARRRADPRRRRRRRCGSDTTARGRCTAGSASPRPCGPSFALYNTADEVDALVGGGRARASASSGWGDRRADGDALPGDHPRPLPGAAPRGSARSVRRAGAPRQSDLRRRGDPPGACSAARAERPADRWWCRTSRTRRWVARSPRRPRRCSPTWRSTGRSRGAVHAGRLHRDGDLAAAR